MYICLRTADFRIASIRRRGVKSPGCKCKKRNTNLHQKESRGCRCSGILVRGCVCALSRYKVNGQRHRLGSAYRLAVYQLAMTTPASITKTALMVSGSNAHTF